jgi:hypothetical protein
MLAAHFKALSQRTRKGKASLMIPAETPEMQNEACLRIFILPIVIC